MQPYIHSLHIYPIKSCQGITCDSVALTSTGFNYDRHWMLVDRQGQFLSQRQLPAMARIQTALSERSLRIGIDDSVQLEIPLDSPEDNRISVSIWRDRCSAAIVSSQASRWFSDFLKVDCELVFLPESEQRAVDPMYAKPDQIVGFADGFPLLIISRASIQQLSDKLAEGIDSNRFRANMIIDGCEAHAEDGWSSLSVNSIEIQLAKPCSRCVIPSIDQQTAEKHPSLLRTLASYRRRDGKVYMGQNGLHLSPGILSTGQIVIPTLRPVDKES